MEVNQLAIKSFKYDDIEECESIFDVKTMDTYSNYKNEHHIIILAKKGKMTIQITICVDKLMYLKGRVNG
jgi:hypothetical protein